MSRNAIGTNIPIEIIFGGTGSTTAPGALTNLGALPLAGGTMTGNLILNGDPTLALQAATKQYADAIAAGFTVKTACVASSTGPLTVVYANGAAGVGATLTNNGAQVAFSIDGVNPTVGQRVLIPFQASSLENGIYTVTDAGSGATNWVLTRATDYDQPAEIQPGTLVPVTSGALYTQTSWIETATVAAVGTDPIVFSQFTASPNSFANVGLTNLSGVAINTTLIPDTDVTWDIGQPTFRWNNGYFDSLRAGDQAGNVLTLSSWDTLNSVWSPFVTLTSNNPPTGVLASGITGTTQAPNDNSTKLATTAYADAISALKANVTLDNLGITAINADLLSAADGSISIGAANNRFDHAFLISTRTGNIAGNSFDLEAYDNTGAVYKSFMTLTAGLTPTASLDGSVTSVTQAPLNNTTLIATTAYVDNAVSSSGSANTALSNLFAVAINTTLLSDTDITDDLGSPSIRWNNLYTTAVRSGPNPGDILNISAYDTFGTFYNQFIMMTAGNPPTCVFDGSITTTTQAPSDNSTKIATTAYVDSAVSGGGGANTALSNLVAVAINTSLVSDTDVTDDLGTQAIRWNNIYTSTIQTGDTAADTLKIGAWDVDGAVFVPYITLTANNTTTCVLANGVTGTTQSPADNSTKLATTAYADAAATAAPGTGANKALSNLTGVAINLGLAPAVDNSIDLGTGTDRWANAYSSTLRTGTGAGNTTLLQAYNTGGSSFTTFATLTANATPTMSLASGVTGTTQSPADNSTKLATTAYADAAATAAPGTGATKALDNLAAVAINTALLPGADNTIDLGDGTHRFRELFGSRVSPGSTSGNTLILSARNVGGASDTAFLTLTSDTTTPTAVLASSVTATTQSASDNSTKIATTAYVDSAVSGGGATVVVSGTSQAMAVGTTYITNNAGLVTCTLPSTAAVGSLISVVGLGAGGWSIAENSGQLIHIGNQVTTTTTGSLSSTNQWDNVQLLCIVADTTWSVIRMVGNITFV